MSSNYLFELGTEELPPKSLKTLAESLKKSVLKGFAEQGLAYENFELFYSPRRLAFVVHKLDDATPLKQTKVFGPPTKIAFDEHGAATKAALAFCSRNGIQAAELQKESDGKVEKICCTKTEGNIETSVLLPSLIQSALDALPIAKRMRWGASRTEFVRPVQWLVLMRDGDVIPANILGQVSAAQSQGHRFLCDEAITITSPLSYAKQMTEQGKVIVDALARKEKIKAQVEAEALSLGGRAVIDPELLEEVNALVEWPVAVSGNFDSEFLEVPAEALISSMKEHQKYFHLVDENGNLLSSFVTVSNVQTTDMSAIKSGNEKVIRPRLADAAFFYATDKKTSLSARREKLKTVVFQAKLGTLYDKTERIKSLALFIAKKLDIEAAPIAQCAELCKSDLVSNMVYEFPEMQGIAGFHYALNDGLEKPVATGIVEHYLPKYAGDTLPSADTGAIVGLADRLDTLTGIFAIGEIPTGSKDPFALRRASVSALRIICEKGYDLDLAEVLEFSLSLHVKLGEDGVKTTPALNYILERFKASYEEAGIASEVWQAVAAKKLSKPLDIDRRVHAVHSFYQSEAALALASANKRVANILAKLDQPVSVSVQPKLFQQDEETKLYEALQQVIKEIEPQLVEMDYANALETLSGLRQAVDAYFAEVMVMTDDLPIRENRLAFLLKLREQFLHIADIRFLAPGK